MSRLQIAPVVLLALVLVPACRKPDVCKGVNGTCVALHVIGSGAVSEVDQLAVSLSGAYSAATKRTPSTPLRQSLPINVPITLPAKGMVAVRVDGFLAGRAIAHGATNVAVASGAHVTVTVTLIGGAATVATDMAAPAEATDMPPVPPSPPDLYIANRDMAGMEKPLGAVCTVGEQCSSGSCADGVCCLTACTDPCHACNLPTAPGQCVALGTGVAPLPGHTTCGPDPAASCMRDGYCDGNGACRLWPSGTVCAQSTCMSGTYVGPGRCDGLGACKKPAPSTCAPYVCQDPTKCWPSCTDNSQCQTPATCNTSVTPGSCGLRANGAQCQGGGDCLSGKCTDGVCCTSSDCGRCAACNLNGMGTCSFVGAGGVDPKNSCVMTDASTCGTDGTCDGKGGCRLWVNGTTCMAGDCDTNTNSPITYACDGAGTCKDTVGATCKPYTCISGTCYNSCGDYQPLKYCKINAIYCAPGCTCSQPSGSDKNDPFCFGTVCGGC